MTIEQLLLAYGVTIPRNEIKMIRHSPKNPGDWELIKNGHFDVYQEGQDIKDKDAFNRKYLMSFIGEDKIRTIFKGFYEVKDVRPYRLGEFPTNIVGNEQQPNNLKVETEKMMEMTDLVDRLIIDWSGRKWIQYYKAQRSVLSILPKGVTEIFPGYLDFFLDWERLENIVNNKEANIEWYHALSKVNGVYVILYKKKDDDEKEWGKLYVGSAYGKEGVWGRWEGYVKTKTNDNKKLEELMRNDPDCYRYFRFSILEVLPKTMVISDVLKHETKVKEKLGSRAYGLNSN
ncbi:MAG: GIY-YIG nuclease family protein [Sphaerochaetaceae bacterium]|nr:GIY-YIG nuclease family protein [Sphaerochaetaceae bacterium]